MSDEQHKNEKAQAGLSGVLLGASGGALFGTDTTHTQFEAKITERIEQLESNWNGEKFETYIDAVAHLLTDRLNEKFKPILDRLDKLENWAKVTDDQIAQPEWCNCDLGCEVAHKVMDGGNYGEPQAQFLNGGFVVAEEWTPTEPEINQPIVTATSDAARQQMQAEENPKRFRDVKVVGGSTLEYSQPKTITPEQVDNHFFESIPRAWRSKKLEDLCTADFIKFTERINAFFNGTK